MDKAVRTWSCEEAKKHGELRRLGYFGSYARGDWGVGSDLDLIAIVGKTTEPFERRSLAWDLSVLPVPVDLLVYTEEEWERLVAEEGFFARRLQQEVVWIYPPGESAS